MKLWGHACLKRTLLWSTSDFISKLNLGKIQKIHHKSLVQTVKKYIDKSGKRRFHGTKALKATEFLSWLGCAVNFFRGLRSYLRKIGTSPTMNSFYRKWRCSAQALPCSVHRQAPGVWHGTLGIHTATRRGDSWEALGVCQGAGWKTSALPNDLPCRIDSPYCVFSSLYVLAFGS